MRTALIAASVAALVAGGAAEAQRMVAPGPGADASHAMPAPAGPSRGAPSMARDSRARRGSRVGGQWRAGMNAPGGWRGYHRLSYGAYLPGYWNRTQFGIADWSTYGLGIPPAGYAWTRYYDDAVLIDGRGQVYDSVDGIDWDGGDVADTSGVAGCGASYAQLGQVPPTYGQSTDAPYPADDRHAATAGYPAPPPIAAWHSPDGGLTVTTTSVGGYAGGSNTVQTAPVVTTTMTGFVEDHVTYVRPRECAPVRHKEVRMPIRYCR